MVCLVACLASAGAAGARTQGVAEAGGRCTKESYARRFGATYEIEVASGREPSLSEGVLRFQARYASTCGNGGSAFTPDVIEKEGMTVVVVHRAEPQCEPARDEPFEWAGLVEVPISEDAMGKIEERGKAYLAFPPDSEYELYLLEVGDPSAFPSYV